MLNGMNCHLKTLSFLVKRFDMKIVLLSVQFVSLYVSFFLIPSGWINTVSSVQLIYKFTRGFCFTGVASLIFLPSIY